MAIGDAALEDRISLVARVGPTPCAILVSAISKGMLLAGTSTSAARGPVPAGMLRSGEATSRVDKGGRRGS